MIEGYLMPAVLFSMTIMNERHGLIFALALGCFHETCAIAQLSQPAAETRRTVDANISGIGIEQVGVLAYPPLMAQNAIYSGDVRAVISVDATGRLYDLLVVAYTRPEFAEVAQAALRRWKYQPARINGRSISSRADIFFEFRDRSVIVQTLPGAMARQTFLGNGKEPYAFAPCRLRDLDRIPIPLEVITPTVNSVTEAHTVTVEFYIDEEGKVRMPAVPRDAANDVFAAAAVAAVEKWRFEPPLRNGRRVLVQAQQEFNFRPEP